MHVSNILGLSFVYILHENKHAACIHLPAETTGIIIIIDNRLQKLS